VGGDIVMEQAQVFAGHNKEMNGGKIKIASVASQGEVISLESDLLVSSFDELGDISISGSGKINIVFGENTLGVSGKQTGLALIKGKNLLLSNRSVTGQLKMIQGSEIVSKTFRYWQTAPIVIEVDQLELRDGSQISSNVFKFGQGNDITIKANEILLSGISEMAVTASNGLVAPNTSGIASLSHTLRADAIESTINIEADKLVIEKQGTVNVASLAVGDAGSINLNCIIQCGCYSIYWNWTRSR